MITDWHFPKFIKKYTVHCLITAVLCIPSGLYLFTQFKELKKEELEFEKYRSSKIEELKDREAELIKRDGLLKENNTAPDNDCILKTKEATERLKKKEEDIKAREKEINKLKVKYSDAARKFNAEQKVIALMDKFSALGVDLHHEDWCDKDYTKRYYEGDAILNQIYSIIRSNNLDSSYTSFLQRHMSGIKTIGSSRNCKKDNGQNMRR